jgi:hypothetical protein
MARRRTLDRMAMRENAEAAERQEQGAEDEAREDEEEAEEPDAEADDSGDDEDAPKPKKKKAAPKKSTTRRTRAPKVVRMKVVWGVFNNSNQRVEAFPYNQKDRAEAFIAEKTAANPKATFFIQPVKEPLEEKV